MPDSMPPEAAGPLVPLPRQVRVLGPHLTLALSLAASADAADRWAGEAFVTWLHETCGVAAAVVGNPSAEASWRMTIERQPGRSPESYHLLIEPNRIALRGADAAGVFYGLQTLKQLIRFHGGQVPCLEIDDQPALRYRAMHLDTKHHQPTEQYIYDLIDELAHYKVNMLVWEWEDKLAYQSHPEIGAPGAFTADQMRQFTDYARQRHMQLVPLVQGLGHVSFILKFPQYRHLREVPDSNWQFNPLEEGTYELLFELFDEAIEATPGSDFFHIGTDEPWELGKGLSGWYAEKHGNDALMQVFVRRCVKHLESRGRTVLTWGGQWHPEMRPEDYPPKSMIFADSEDPAYLAKAKEAGFPGWVYASNPGIEPLVLPLFPSVQPLYWSGNNRGPRTGRDITGAFLGTAGPIGEAARAGSVKGSIATSWDDSGLHLQAWMPRFICAAEFSWNPQERDIERWAETFFANYFGEQSRNLRELFTLLYEGVHFYNHTLQRAVWHWYNLGKLHLPDMPREDLEYNNYWRVQNVELIRHARDQRQRMARAIDILDRNRAAGAEHAYDLEIYRTCAELVRHNANLFLMLSDVEAAISEASDRWHYANHRKAVEALERGQALIRSHLADRKAIYTNLVAVWERTRLPKGLSLPDKPFVYARDRARHFANRTPDMSYLILDEQLLDLERYVKTLEAYTVAYERQHCAAASTNAVK
ncbi:MAG: family 20 glycosylhydrolase [Phycisphaeraceae bacterium]